jgi:predicted transcriptional regulator
VAQTLNNTRFRAFQGNAALGPSRLERYIAILKVLAKHDTRTIRQLLYNGDLKLFSLEDHLYSLIEFGVVKEKPLGTQKVYSLTRKGARVVAYFTQKETQNIFIANRIEAID